MNVSRRPDGIGREDEIRGGLEDLIPVELAPRHLRLAFHDAGTYDVTTHSGGAHGAIHLLTELHRSENATMAPCVKILHSAKERFPDVSWADLVALGGAAAVELMDGPLIRIGLGRVDADIPAPEHRLPTTSEGVVHLRAHFIRMGLTPRDLVALSGAHTVGQIGDRPVTLQFTNSYFKELLSPSSSSLLDSDRALLQDSELRGYVEQYARDETAFFADFTSAYQSLTWLGGEPPA
jgi:L-ascorbate peroxidase